MTKEDLPDTMLRVFDERFENCMPRNLSEWQKAAWQVSKDHGWHDVPGDGTIARVPERIALLHSEVSELLEAYRKNPLAPCDKGIALSCAAEELADIAIPGTLNTAMTLEFEGAGVAASVQSVTLLTYDTIDGTTPA